MIQSPSRVRVRVLGIELALGEPEALLAERAARQIGVAGSDIASLRIARKALDARVRGGARRLAFVYHVDVELDARKTRGQDFRRAERAGRVRPAPAPAAAVLEHVHASARSARAAVVGAGPAGLFAAWALAQNGVGVDLVERGPPLEARARPVVAFHRTRELDPEANLLYGEGGAGTYSDGKIYTRVDDPLEVPILEELVRCGAPPEIVYDSLAHIGTDRLHRILPALRRALESLGVRFHFGVRLDALALTDDALRRVRALRTSAGEVPCDVAFLALGHSARDTARALFAQGVPHEAKPFQLGVRIEHPQELVDRARYGPAASVLGAASYNLIARAAGDLPAAYSFCMCPGGRIVASASEPGLLCTNGMSNSRHSSSWATAAIVTTFGPQDFGREPFDGVEFQRELETRFFVAGGADWTAPAQTAEDFVAGRASARVRHSTYPFGTRPGRIDELLPPRARDSVRRALASFERVIPGFASPEGLLVGVETRSSSPLRVPREEGSARARGFANLYPIGEGAGWAGGIMSAALDGANAAREWLARGPA